MTAAEADGWSERHSEGVSSALAVSVVDLPQGRYVRVDVKSDPPVRVDMEPNGALWLARELLTARNDADVLLRIANPDDDPRVEREPRGETR